MSNSYNQLVEEIKKLKQQHNAIVLAHFYQDDEIQDVADAIGDSLFLAEEGKRNAADVILLAGVVFMAESVKILSPQKTVLVPDLKAGCSLVDATPADEYRKWRLKHPDALAITYINSSTEVKALSDVICTSSNAEKIVKAIPKDRPILFGPDKNLGRWLASKTGRDMTLWQGSCEVHVLFSAQMLFELKQEHPDAVVIAHPECDDGVLSYADVIGSTSRLLQEVEKNPSSKFIVATEEGIFYQMKKKRPNAQLIQAPIDNGCACNRCPHMRRNTLEKVRDALKNLSPQVQIDEYKRVQAVRSLERMIKITHDQEVDWPKTFTEL